MVSAPLRCRRILLVTTLLAALPPAAALGQTDRPSYGEPPGGHRAGGEASRPRVHWGLAGGPALEVSTPGGREAQRGLLVVPSIGFRITSWFEYVVEGHVTRFFTPAAGHVVGVVPLGWRLRARGRTHPFVSMGAGVTATNLAGLSGIDRRMNFLTQIGAGVRRVTAGGSILWMEGRFSHLSNLSTVPPNLGMENFVVLAGYGR